MRRASPITHFVVGAAMEALEQANALTGTERLGVIGCSMCGGIQYTVRFFQEVLANPPAASPLLFPETVFNAPFSHLASVLGRDALYTTFIGDDAVFLEALALGADWLLQNQVDCCAVVGAEELGWTVASAFRLFSHRAVVSEGAAALCLRRAPGPRNVAQLERVTDSHVYAPDQNADAAARRVRRELAAGPVADLLVDARQGLTRNDRPEAAAWLDWPGRRISPRKVLGQGMSAAAGWQCVLAVDALARGQSARAWVSAAGCNAQAIGASFCRFP